MAYSTLNDLKKAVDDSGALLTLTLQELRAACGERANTNARADITLQLRKLGLAHQPSELPGAPDKRVRIYTRSSPMGELIRALRTFSPDSDQLLRVAAGTNAGPLH